MKGYLLLILSLLVLGLSVASLIGCTTGSRDVPAVPDKDDGDDDDGDDDDGDDDDEDDDDDDGEDQCDDPLTFEHSGLEEAVREAIDKEEDDITVEDVQDLTELSASGFADEDEEDVDIEGIQCLTD